MSDVLYRTWRPQTFDDVVGQRHVTRTLKNALGAGQVGHAYLFAGPRGTGKTSVARILARAVNCREGPTAEPCGACDACRSILAGTAVDVVEIDGGSNRKIEDARDLRERVVLAPAQFRTKVYIIDEVHQLTDHAFNALLKTFEEPPGHVMFILATTDPQKIPLTIVSRCQRFDFHRLAARDILERLALVARTSGLEVEPAALELMVRKADGSLRDALSLLDQARAFAGDAVRASDLAEVLGLVDDEGLAAVTVAALEGRPGDALAAVGAFLDAGRDIRQLAEDLLQYGRDLLAARLAPDPEAVLDRPAEAVARLRDLGRRLDAAAVARWLRALSQAVADMRGGAHPRLALDVALLAFGTGDEGPGTAPVSGNGPGAGGNGPTVARAAAGEVAAAAVAEAPVAAAATGPAAAAAEAAPEAPAPVAGAAAWPAVLEAVRQARPATHALLSAGRPGETTRGAVVVRFPEGCRFHAESLERKSHRSVVEKALAQVLGHPVRLTCAVDAGDGPPAAGPPAAGAEAAGPAGGEPPPAGDDLLRPALELFGGEVVDGED